MEKKIPNTYYCTIELDIFRTAILVLVSEDMETILDDLPTIYKSFNIPEETSKKDIWEIRKIYDSDGYMTPGHTIRLPNEAGDVIMIFKAKTIADVSEELIVHETHHASNYICSFRGIEDEECEAYLQEYLFNQMLNAIDDWNKKHKKKKK